tara:strand:+ start:281 stop:487 length:207 start_codon:yes stop_codon:yes gene_type:complete
MVDQEVVEVHLMAQVEQVILLRQILLKVIMVVITHQTLEVEVVVLQLLEAMPHQELVEQVELVLQIQF